MSTVSFWSVFPIDHNHYSVIGVRGLVTHYHVSGSQYVNVGLLEPKLWDIYISISIFHHFTEDGDVFHV